MASTSKIEDIIDEIEAYIDDCKPSAFSTNKIVVNRDELESLIQELRTKTPDEIKKYQRMIANREQILADAKAKADEIISQAQVQTNELVSEHQIMQQAYAQANEVILIAQKNAQEKIDRATEDANNIRMGAIAYTDELLANIQTILANSIETTRARDEAFLNTMQVYLDTVNGNRAALVPDSLNDGDSDPAASLDSTGEAAATAEPALAPAEAQTSDVNDDDVIVVHDAARPMVTDESLSDVICVCRKHGNSMAIIDCVDTMYAREDVGTSQVLERSMMVRGQTPEAVTGKRMREMYRAADEKKIHDDSISALQIALGWKVYFAKGSEQNIKLTRPTDLKFFEMWLAAQKKVQRKDSE